MGVERKMKTTVVTRTERRSPGGTLLSIKRSVRFKIHTNCYALQRTLGGVQKEVYYEGEGLPLLPDCSQLRTSPGDIKRIECQGEKRRRIEASAQTIAGSEEYWSIRELEVARRDVMRTESPRHCSPASRTVRWASATGPSQRNEHCESAPALLNSTDAADAAEMDQCGTDFAMQILAELNNLRRASKRGPPLLVDEYLMLRAKTIALRVVLDNDTRAFDEEKRRGSAIVLWVGPISHEASLTKRVIQDWLRDLESREPHRRNYFYDGTLRKVGVACAQFITHENYCAIVAMFE